MSVDKWACCCGCGLDRTSPKMRSIFEDFIKAKFDDAFIVRATSCEEHNRSVGGSVESGHLAMWGDGGESVALDIGLERGWTRERYRQFFILCWRVGIMCIIDHRNKGTVHIDMKPRIGFGRYNTYGTIEWLI